jgi:predicted DsbA family dithiol-disulfide isomerase
MFANQDKLDTQSLKDAAKKIGVDAAKFNACLDENKYLAQVESDLNEGQNIGVKSTPTFFVNGLLIQGAQPLEVFSEVIDEELAK